jgi:glycosyltransferase involved in cell wall biosynthesis
MNEPRHIGLNIIFLEPWMGGMVTYVHRLVPELVQLRPNLRVSVFTNPSARQALADQPWTDSVELVTHPLVGRRFTRAISELTVLGSLADRRGVDVLHSFAMIAPLRMRAKNVVTIPDLIWFHHPASLSRVTTSFWRMTVPFVARRATRVLTFSTASRDDIVAHLRVPEHRVDVVLLGPGALEAGDPTPEGELRERMGLGVGPIVLAVSTKVPHKNLRRLVEAMAAVHDQHPDAVLVLPGRPTEHERELRQHASEIGVDQAVRFCGWLSAADLEGLYRAATCFVYPSLREGFGLPVLEAMRRGIPVACSNTSSMPEVGGEAVLYFDPRDTASIADAITLLVSDGELRERLAGAGHERQRMFTWRATAEATLESYTRACAERR